MSVTFQTEGFKRFDKKLLDMDRKIAKKVVRQSVRASQKIILGQVRSNASSMVGGTMGNLISKLTTIRAPKKQRKGSYMLIVRQRPDSSEFIYYTKSIVGGRAAGTRYYIPAAIEYGHGFPGRSGTKDVAPIPFTRIAFEQKKNAAIRQFNTSVINAINRL
jgi:hypothetical protein